MEDKKGRPVLVMKMFLVRQDQSEQLSEVSFTKKLSMSEIVRISLDTYFQQHTQPEAKS